LISLIPSDFYQWKSVFIDSSQINQKISLETVRNCEKSRKTIRIQEQSLEVLEIVEKQENQ
jgi:hypothetical protein